MKSYDYACKRTQRKLQSMNSLKSSQTIKQEKVDAAIEEVESAKKLEEESREALRTTNDRIRSSYSLFQSYRESDATEQITSYAKKQLLLQQTLLHNLEALCDMVNA